MKSYQNANFPVFDGYNHAQYQMQDPNGFAEKLKTIIEINNMPDLLFMKGN